MTTFLSIIYIVGAMLIAMGAFMIHLGKSVGAGLLCFGLILIGISAGIVNFGRVI